MNNNWMMRNVEHAEIRHVFGSLAACVRITGGDLPTILHYIHNPDRIEGAPDAGASPTAFAEALIEAARTEQAGEEWDRHEKPTIALIADLLDVCRPVARRALVAAGKWPKPKVEKPAKRAKAVPA